MKRIVKIRVRVKGNRVITTIQKNGMKTTKTKYIKTW